MIKGAVISPCTYYRYRLWRTWSPKPPLVFVMLNPSTADEHEDDPTIRKCMGFAERLGFGGIEVVNLFAWRATDPKELKCENGNVLGVIGPENDRFINLAVSLHSTTTVFAWGTHGQTHISRVIAVRDFVQRRLFELGATAPQCLGYTEKSAQPRHPLMLPYATPLQRYIG